MQLNRRALFFPGLYLFIMTILCLVAETDLQGGEQFIPVALLGFPWTIFLVPVMQMLPGGDHPILGRLDLFFFFVILCGGINSCLLYAAIRAFQRFSGEDRVSLKLK